MGSRDILVWPLVSMGSSRIWFLRVRSLKWILGTCSLQFLVSMLGSFLDALLVLSIGVGLSQMPLQSQLLFRPDIPLSCLRCALIHSRWFRVHWIHLFSWWTFSIVGASVYFGIRCLHSSSQDAGKHYINAMCHRDRSSISNHLSFSLFVYHHGQSWSGSWLAAL
jgi:hypothetical protein